MSCSYINEIHKNTRHGDARQKGKIGKEMLALLKTIGDNIGKGTTLVETHSRLRIKNLFIFRNEISRRNKRHCPVCKW